MICNQIIVSQVNNISSLIMRLIVVFQLELDNHRLQLDEKLKPNGSNYSWQLFISNSSIS